MVLKKTITILKRKMKIVKSFILTVILAFAFVFVGCGKEKPGDITKYKLGNETHYKVVQLANNLTVNITDKMNNFHIIGNASVTYKNVSIVVKEREQSDLKIYFSNAKIIGDSVLLACEGALENVEIVAEGTNELYGGESSFAIDGIDNIVFSGSGKMKVVGGTADKEQEASNAINTSKIDVNMTGNLTIVGGSGCNGENGANGGNGTTASVGVGSTPGNRGEDGTKGTAGCGALSNSVLLNIISGKVSLIGGSGGNGGNGGAGGNGGETSMFAQGQQAGGVGGNGGNAGRGGRIFDGDIFFADDYNHDNYENIAGVDGIPGQGGAGGWSGGQRGSGQAKWQSANGQNGVVE